MKREHRLTGSLIMAVLLLLPLTTACNSSGSDGGDPFTPPVSVEGDYAISVGWTSDGCTGSLSGETEAGMLEISQNGNTLVGTLSDECGEVSDVMAGSVNGDSVQFMFTESEGDAGCTLTTTGVVNGTVSGNTSNGTVVLTIDGTGAGCPPILPCQVSGNYDLQQCPPADCTPNDCSVGGGGGGLRLRIE